MVRVTVPIPGRSYDVVVGGVIPPSDVQTLIDAPARAEAAVLDRLQALLEQSLLESVRPAEGGPQGLGHRVERRVGHLRHPSRDA